MKISCIIPAKDNKDPKLRDLIRSIKAQNFPQSQIEIIVVTEGDSEQAKAIGIRKAKGEICCMLCSDNYFTDPNLFDLVCKFLKDNPDLDSIYEKHYAYVPKDNCLNRYFSLIGNNDPIPFYLGKCDRHPYAEGIYKERGIPSYGCNGFFVRRECFKKADLDHYYPMDVHVDMNLRYGKITQGTVWHRTTDGNLFKFLARRYRYARDLYCDRSDRRWKMLNDRKDYWRLFLFILATLTVIQPLIVSILGFCRIRDFAWFYHPIVCFGFLVMYTGLTARTCLKRLSLFLRTIVKTV